MLYVQITIVKIQSNFHFETEIERNFQFWARSEFEVQTLTNTSNCTWRLDPRRGLKNINTIYLKVKSKVLQDNYFNTPSSIYPFPFPLQTLNTSRTLEKIVDIYFSSLKLFKVLKWHYFSIKIIYIVSTIINWRQKINQSKQHQSTSSRSITCKRW